MALITPPQNPSRDTIELSHPNFTGKSIYSNGWSENQALCMAQWQREFMGMIGDFDTLTAPQYGLDKDADLRKFMKGMAVDGSKWAVENIGAGKELVYLMTEEVKDKIEEALANDSDPVLQMRLKKLEAATITFADYDISIKQIADDNSAICVYQLTASDCPSAGAIGDHVPSAIKACLPYLADRASFQDLWPDVIDANPHLALNPRTRVPMPDFLSNRDIITFDSETGEFDEQMEPVLTDYENKILDLKDNPQKRETVLQQLNQARTDIFNQMLQERITNAGGAYVIASYRHINYKFNADASELENGTDWEAEKDTEKYRGILLARKEILESIRDS